MSIFCDIGEIVRSKGMELDWQSIAAQARQWGGLCSVYFILRLAKELLGVAVPEEWLTSIRPDDFEEKYLILAGQRIFYRNWFDETLIPSPNVSRLWDRKGLDRKLVLIRDRMLPSRKIMARDISRKSEFLAHLLILPGEVERTIGTQLEYVVAAYARRPKNTIRSGARQ